MQKLVCFRQVFAAERGEVEAGKGRAGGVKSWADSG